MSKLTLEGRQNPDARQHPKASPESPNPQTPNQPANGRLIVGIDLGTTRCAVATAEVRRPGSIFEVTVHDFSPDAHSKHVPYPPTSLYYKEGTRLPATGTDVKKILKASSSRRDFDPDSLFRLWKLMFHSHQNDDSIKEIQADIQRQLDALGKTAYDLLHDCKALFYFHESEACFYQFQCPFYFHILMLIP